MPEKFKATRGGHRKRASKPEYRSLEMIQSEEQRREMKKNRALETGGTKNTNIRVSGVPGGSKRTWQKIFHNIIAENFSSFMKTLTYRSQKLNKP